MLIFGLGFSLAIFVICLAVFVFVKWTHIQARKYDEELERQFKDEDDYKLQDYAYSDPRAMHELMRRHRPKGFER